MTSEVSSQPAGHISVDDEEKMAVVAAGYRKLCSDVTLVTGKDGFFRTFDSQVTNSMSERQFEEFSALETDQERVFFVWNLPTLHSILKIKLAYREKREKDANMSKTDGNGFFQNGKYKTAINLYNQTVALATPGQQLAVGFANRSACLFHLQFYDRCLDDINMALQSNYPPELQYKLLDRRAACLLKLGRVGESRTALNELLDTLQLAEMTSDKRLSWQHKTHAKLAEIQGRKDFTYLNPPPDVETVEVPRLSSVNARFPSASTAVSVSYSVEQQRHVRATQQIRPGHVLVVEKAHASALHPSKNGTHCVACLKRVFTVLPCDTCSAVIFCSARCKQEAVFHQWECRLHNMLVASGMSNLTYLALRLITKHSMRTFRQLRPALESMPIQRDNPPSTNEQGDVYDSTSYLAIHQLATLSELRQPQDMLHRAIMAAFLLKCLRCVGYFEEKATTLTVEDSVASRPLSADESFIGGLLLRHLQMLQFNAHEVGEFLMMSPGQYKQSRSVTIGVAVYPTVAFFNHSCDGDVARTFIGDTMVVRSIKHLSAGECVHENYGPIFTHKTRQDRQQTLQSRYWFKCACVPCSLDWCDYDGFDVNTVNLRCQKCSSSMPNPASGRDGNPVCRECHHKNNIVDLFRRLAGAQELYQSAMHIMDEGDARRALRVFYRFIDESLPVVTLPNRDLSLCYEAMRICLASVGSNHAIRSKRRAT